MEMTFRISRNQLLAALLGLAVVAGIAALTLSSTSSPAPVSAAGGTNVATFTKWVTDTDFPAFPWDMQGVVGGDVGNGTFTGEVVSRDPTVANGQITKIVANYHFHGSAHSLTALLDVTQNNETGKAVLKGVVTDGWSDGSLVHGEYETMAVCPISTPGNIFGTTCFQGTLRILPVSPR
jgi:hypothetical protein